MFLLIIMATTISFDTDMVLWMYVKQQVDQGDYPLATQEETTDFLAALSHLAA